MADALEFGDLGMLTSRFHRSNPPPPRSGPWGRGWLDGKAGYARATFLHLSRCALDEVLDSDQCLLLRVPRPLSVRPRAPSARSAGRCQRKPCRARPARPSGTGRNPRASPRPDPPGPRNRPGQFRSPSFLLLVPFCISLPRPTLISFSSRVSRVLAERDHRNQPSAKAGQLQCDGLASSPSSSVRPTTERSKSLPPWRLVSYHPLG